MARHLVVGLLTVLMLQASLAPAASPVSAEELPKEKGVARTVKMFDMFCLTQLPNVDGVARFAGFGEFAQITDDELEPYKLGTPAEELQAWRFHDLGAELILTASRSKPDETFKKQFPAFANSRNVACSLLIPNGDPPEEILKQLAQRLGREPDETRNEAGTQVYGWSAQTDRTVSRVYYRAPAEQGRKSTLSASAFVKD